MKHHQENPVNNTAAAAEATSLSPTVKKTRGFQLSKLLSFDAAVDAIREKLTFDTVKDEDKTKVETPDSSSRNSIFHETGTLTSAEKKESGLLSPSLQSIDNAIQTIRSKLGIGEEKYDVNTASTNTNASTGETASIKTDTPSSTTISQAIFQFPPILSLDTTIQTIREKFGLDHANRGETINASHENSSSPSATKHGAEILASPTTKDNSSGTLENSPTKGTSKESSTNDIMSPNALSPNKSSSRRTRTVSFQTEPIIIESREERAFVFTGSSSVPLKPAIRMPPRSPDIKPDGTNKLKKLFSLDSENTKSKLGKSVHVHKK